MASARYQGPIKLVLFDVDGVLTDGGLHIDGKGEQFKTFNVRDGLAVALLRVYGIRCGVLSGKASPSLDFRIRQLGMDVAVTGRLEKLDALAAICGDVGVCESEIAYVGDDVVDLPLAGRVGRFYAPSDAHPLVLAAADVVTDARGGRGVGREVAERVLAEGGVDLQAAYAPLIAGWSAAGAVQ
ncbi:TPA: KdsC family phosphatase [Stenotrophomonas maltophilia]|uniref:KdsC family phosphatase n=1 Tax=Stenotrophomonas maltophilia TaxID=40324 RepID=UPI0021D8A9B3|nr:phenylphosphate carboxylase subunit delta [Stenotrophomonas maltophilia]UXY49861.1 phenylphosphate carboxylase subunit delta [Stenotrophomonas maltophilia]